jgi:hypothetical protein
MSSLQTTVRLSPLVDDLLGQLAVLRGLSRSAIITTGILAQAEASGLIPSCAAVLANLTQESLTDPTRLEQLRLSARRSRARKQGLDVPKLRPGRPRRS